MQRHILVSTIKIFHSNRTTKIGVCNATKDTWTGETLFEMRRRWWIEGIVNDAEQGRRLMERVIGAEQRFRHGRMVMIVRGGSRWDIRRGKVLVLVEIHWTSGTEDHVHHGYGLCRRERQTEPMISHPHRSL